MKKNESNVKKLIIAGLSTAFLTSVFLDVNNKTLIKAKANDFRVEGKLEGRNYKFKEKQNTIINLENDEIKIKENKVIIKNNEREKKIFRKVGIDYVNRKYFFKLKNDLDSNINPEQLEIEFDTNREEAEVLERIESSVAGGSACYRLNKNYTIRALAYKTGLSISTIVRKNRWLETKNVNFLLRTNTKLILPNFYVEKRIKDKYCLPVIKILNKKNSNSPDFLNSNQRFGHFKFSPRQQAVFNLPDGNMFSDEDRRSFSESSTNVPNPQQHSTDNSLHPSGRESTSSESSTNVPNPQQHSTDNSLHPSGRESTSSESSTNVPNSQQHSTDNSLHSSGGEFFIPIVENHDDVLNPQQHSTDNLHLSGGEFTNENQSSVDEWFMNILPELNAQQHSTNNSLHSSGGESTSIDENHDDLPNPQRHSTDNSLHPSGREFFIPTDENFTNTWPTNLLSSFEIDNLSS